MNKPVLVVMAAGMGSRYGGMKQIDPVGPNGEVIIDYSLYDAYRAGFRTVIFVIKHEIEEAFRAAIGDRISKIMEVKYAFQQLDILPTGFVRSREADCHVLVDMLSKNEIPLRVTHNDTKLNNVLIDKTSKKGVCVIDLDTVMPGLAAYDFGDSIRFGANDCAEDEPDQNKVHFDLHLFEVFAKGFLSTAGATMSEQEKSSLVWGAKLMTLECGMRFLTDYLEGDHYFRISRPAQNLDRARTQFTLVKGMEAAFADMMRIIQKY